MLQEKPMVERNELFIKDIILFLFEVNLENDIQITLISERTHSNLFF